MDVQCPQCLQVFEHSEYRWRGADGATYQREKPGWAARLGEWLDVPDRREDKPRADLLAQSLQFTCPNGDEVPEDLHRQRTHVIGVVGPPGSSKSHFLGALLHLLTAYDALADFSLTAQFLPWSETWFRTQYVAPLWGQHRALPRTLTLAEAPGRVPSLALSLRDPYTGSKTNLIFVDSSGEDLADPPRQAHCAPYLGAAGGIIFLVDPSMVPGFVGRLPSGAPVVDVGNPAGTIVANTARTVRFIRGIDDRHQIDDVPVAVAIAKSDLLWAVPGVQRHWLEDDPRMPASTRLAAIHRNSADIAGFIEYHQGRSLLLELQGAFPRQTFHLVSATGSSPVGPPDGRRFPTLTPQHCLDPLLALLGELGVIPTDTQE